MNKGLQVYKIYYYPPEENFPTSKVWLYFNRKQGDKLLGTKSLCFENIENHRKFILNNLLYNIYILEKRSEGCIPSSIQIGTYRLRLLDAILVELRKEIIEIWKKREEKIKVIQNETRTIKG